MGPCITNCSHHLSFISSLGDSPFIIYQWTPITFHFLKCVMLSLSHPGLYSCLKLFSLPISILSCRSRLLSPPPGYLALPSTSARVDAPPIISCTSPNPLYSNCHFTSPRPLLPEDGVRAPSSVTISEALKNLLNIF